MKLFTLVADLTLDTAGFATQVANAKKEGQSLAEAIGADSESIKSSFTDAFSFAAGDLLADAIQQGIIALGDFVGDSVTAAAGLESTQRRITKVFGDMAGDVNAWAATTKEQYGISAASAESYASRIGALLSSETIGLTTEEIYRMSTSLTGLAGDLASLYGFSLDTTFEKLLSGLRGETEAIEDLGVDMRAAALASSLGISEADWGGLDQRTRTLAMYEHIIASTTTAQGNFVDTQDTYASQLQLFNSNIAELQATLGSGLLPVMTGLLTWFNSFFEAEEQATETTAEFGAGLSASYADVSLTTERAWALVTALEEMEATSKDAAASDMWNAILEELNTVLPGIGNLIDDTTGQINGGTEALRAYVEQWETSAYELARTTAIKSYYDEYAQMQRELYDLEIESAINQRMIDGMTANVDIALASLMEQAIIPYISADYRTADNLAYLRSDEGLQELYEALATGDLDAVISGTGFSLSSMLDEAGAWDKSGTLQTLISQYEKALDTLPTYEEKIAETREQIAAYEQRLAVLEQIVATQEPPLVEITVNNTANDDVIVSKVEQKISRSAKNKSFTTSAK